MLALLSVFATWLLYEVVTWIGRQTGLTPPWWLEIPSIITFYGVSYKIFDKWLWRKPIIRQLGLVRIPDLNGTWKGQIKSSYDDFKEEHDATVKIFQSWTQIEVVQETKESKGRSFIAAVHTKEPDAIRLFFMYQNIPEIDADPGMRSHFGAAQLILSADGKSLTGDYYNCGRDRTTWGKLHFDKS